MEELNPREGDESVLLEFNMRQRLFVCFHVLFWQGRSKCSPLLILDGCWEQQGRAPLACSPRMPAMTVCGLHQEMLRSSYGGGLDLPREYITGVSSTSEL